MSNLGSVTYVHMSILIQQKRQKKKNDSKQTLVNSIKCACRNKKHCSRLRSPKSELWLRICLDLHKAREPPSNGDSSRLLTHSSTAMLGTILHMTFDLVEEPRPGAKQGRGWGGVGWGCWHAGCLALWKREK